MKIFICDGTEEGFFSAVYCGLSEPDCLITGDGAIQIPFGGELVRVVADEEKHRRVIGAVLRRDDGAVNDVGLALRSCDARKEQIAFGYIKRLLERKSTIKNAYNLSETVEFNALLYKVTGEVHRLKGFLRFMESAGGALYAPYSPDNDVTDLLMPHFAERLKAEKFVIHDIKRKTAGIYDGNEWIMTRAGEAEICLSDGERAFETLWKKYYKTVNIKERPHERQMKGSMPVRYWKHLPEKHDFE